MLINKGIRKFQYGGCPGLNCNKTTNLLWHETTEDLWFSACSEECAKDYSQFMLKLIQDRREKECSSEKASASIAHTSS